MQYDVVVVGGGIIGAAISYHLVRAGARTLLVDRVDRGRATDAAAGIISADTYSGPSDDWASFATAAADYYPELLASVGVDEDAWGYRRCGVLMLAYNDHDERKFDALMEHVGRRRAAVDAVREVSAARALELLPALSTPLRALYSPRAARVDGRLMTASLLQAAQLAGLQMLRAGVEGLELRRGKVASGRIGEDRVRGDWFVIAGGAWSTQLAQPLAVACGVEPQRGQLVHLTNRDLTTDGWPIVEGFRGHYLLPWPQGRVVAGATRETGSGFATAPTNSGIAEVLEEAVRVMPALDEAVMTEARVGLRPVSCDGLPLLGRVATAANVVIATGHGAHGLQLGPYSAKLVAELILSGAAPELEPFSPRRSFHPDLDG